MDFYGKMRELTQTRLVFWCFPPAFCLKDAFFLSHQTFNKQFRQPFQVIRQGLQNMPDTRFCQSLIAQDFAAEPVRLTAKSTLNNTPESDNQTIALQLPHGQRFVLYRLA